MSATILHVVDDAEVQSVASFVGDLRASPPAFELYCRASSGRYTHEQFVADSEAGRASSKDIYYLAHELISRPGSPGVYMDLELRMMLLEGYWLTEPDVDEDVPEAASRFFEAHRQDLVCGREKANVERLSRRLTKRGFSEAFIRDVVLLNRLFSWEKGPVAAAGAYPIWIIAGWDNYEGHLTAKEFSALETESPDGFLAHFEAASHVAGDEAELQLRVVTRLREVRRSVCASSNGVCVAVSSL